MAASKKDSFEKSQQQIARFAKALSHPARLEILKILAERSSCICGEIVEVLPLSQATVSQHLRELQKAGIIKGTIDGKKSCYCIDWHAFKGFEEQTRQFISGIINVTQDQSCCELRGE